MFSIAIDCLSALLVKATANDNIEAPKWVLKKIDSHRRKFFGVGADSTSCQGRCLVNWDIASMPRKDGGLGILKVLEHNLARLGSWLWKFITR
ncbi:hypothetical protein Cni_G11612 [Canna indica]|uniref:Uncharacterized protein n=1 Tax=Canna indica TaxID=4628 RepID=A0AAQ3QBD9_9LILI|nr:hypothetical protein Cni_G11612 [Canna indica]